MIKINNKKVVRRVLFVILLVVLCIVFLVFLSDKKEGFPGNIDFIMKDHALYPLVQDIRSGNVKLENIKEYYESHFTYPDKNYAGVNKVIPINRLRNGFILILSGGGARGYAHAGVLKVLEKYGLKPSVIIGTSAGSLVGYLYSSGYSPDEIVQIIKNSEKKLEVLSKVTLTPEKRSKILRSIIKPYFKVKNIKETKIPFFVNTTDIQSCSGQIFSEGDSLSLVMASMGIPFIFAPVIYRNFILVDGGLYDNFGCYFVDILRKRPEFKDLPALVVDVSASTDMSSSVQTSYILLEISKHIELLGKNKERIKNKDDLLRIINNIFFVLKNRGELSPERISNMYILSPFLNQMKIFEFQKYGFAIERGEEIAEQSFTE